MNITRLDHILRFSDESVKPAAPVQPIGASFGDVLSAKMKEGLDATEAAEATAQDKATKLATGEITDISDVMIASERANLTLGVTLAVRNKVLEAYQEVMRMPI